MWLFHIACTPHILGMRCLYVLPVCRELIYAGRYDKLSINTLTARLSTKHVTWLPNKVKVESKQVLLSKLCHWLINDYVMILLKVRYGSSL